MRKSNLSIKLKRIILMVGVLTLASVSTACGKTNSEEPVSSTAVETVVEESKDFSISLEESKEVEEFFKSQQAVLSESVDEDGEVHYDTPISHSEAEEQITNNMISDIKEVWNSGEMSEEELRETINKMLYYSTQEEKDEFYNSLLASKPSNTSVPTQVASKETKPTQQQSKPAQTKPVQTQPQTQPETQPQTQPQTQPETQPQITEPQITEPETQPQIVEPQTQPAEQPKSNGSSDYTDLYNLPDGVHRVNIPGIGWVRTDDPRVAGMGVGHNQSDDLSPEDKAREDAIIWQ